MTAVIVIGVGLAIASLGAEFFKYRFAAEALRDVPPAKRAEIITAVGSAWPGWRTPVVSIFLSQPRKSRTPVEGPDSS